MQRSTQRFHLGLGFCLFALFSGCQAEPSTFPFEFSLAIHLGNNAFFTLSDDSGTVVEDEKMLQNALDAANRIFGPAGVKFRSSMIERVSLSKSDIKSNSDRNALADCISMYCDSTIQLIVTQSLVDLDRKDEVLAGLLWTYGGSEKSRKNQRYIILSGLDSRYDTLAHELGHWFGLDHVEDVNNLMQPGSSRRNSNLTAEQICIIRRKAAGLLSH